MPLSLMEGNLISSVSNQLMECISLPHIPSFGTSFTHFLAEVFHLTWSSCVSSLVSIGASPDQTENVRSQSNRLSESWLNFRNSIGMRVSIIGLWSNDWSWPRTGTLHKSDITAYLRRSDNIHAKFQQSCMP